MTREDAENLASQLPESLEGTVTGEREIDRGLSHEEFIERGHRRENEEGDFSMSATERHVPAVLSVVGRAMRDKRFAGVRDQLPADFENRLNESL